MNKAMPKNQLKLKQDDNSNPSEPLKSSLSGTFISSSNFSSSISEDSSVFWYNDDWEFQDELSRKFKCIQKTKSEDRDKPDDQKPISSRLK